MAVIAFGTLEKHGVNVPVVPIGLNYFRGHRFRARAVVELRRLLQAACMRAIMIKFSSEWELDRGRL